MNTNVSTWYTNMSEENPEHPIFKDILDSNQEDHFEKSCKSLSLKDFGEYIWKYEEERLNRQSNIVLENPNGMLHQIPVLCNVEDDLLVQDVELILGQSLTLLGAVRRAENSLKNIRKRMLDTQEELIKLDQSSRNLETGRLKFDGIMERLVQENPVEPLKKQVKMLIGKREQLNGGMDMTGMRRSSSMTSEPIYARSMSCCGCLTDIQCPLNLKDPVHSLEQELSGLQLR